MKANGHIKVDNSECINHPCDHADRKVAIGDAVIPDMNEPAKLEVKFFELSPRGPYWVVETDYTGYSVVYGCTSIGGLYHFDYAWILSRKPTLDGKIVKDIMDKLTGFGIPVEEFMKTEQDGCRY